MSAQASSWPRGSYSDGFRDGLADLRNRLSDRITQVENPTDVSIQDLVSVLVRQADLVEELQRLVVIQARVVGAIHDMIDAVIVYGELDPGRMGRHCIRIHPLDVGARRLR